MADSRSVLWVVGHPEPRSLTGLLGEQGRLTLRDAGHNVELSDLYAMQWNPVVDLLEYPGDGLEPVSVATASRRAYENGGLRADVRQEQDKLARADALVIQFPLWWFGMPAILKGWFDRVFVEGFAYGVRGPDGRTRRYGDGVLAGKRAIVIVTAGGRAEAFSGRGINGPYDDLLFPLLHGTLFYAGAAVLPPVFVAGADRMGPEDTAQAAEAVMERMRTLWTTPPIAYRSQYGGDYDEKLILRETVAPGQGGLDIHRS